MTGLLVDISSDLTFSVAIPGRETATGRICAHGATVTVATSDPAVVWEAALGAPAGGPGGRGGPAALRVVADHLADQGVTVSVTGPGGRVASVGAGIDSSLGRITTGSRRVSLGRPAALAPLVRARVVVAVHAHGRAIAIVAGGAAAVTALGRYWLREHADS